MRLLLDEMLTPSIARGLRDCGFDAVTVLELRLEGTPDASLLRIARDARRTIVTKNVRDFRRLQQQAFGDGDGHFGLILLARDIDTSRAATGRLVRTLAEIAAGHPGDDSLRNQELWL